MDYAIQTEINKRVSLSLVSVIWQKKFCNFSWWWLGCDQTWTIWDQDQCQVDTGLLLVLGWSKTCGDASLLGMSASSMSYCLNTHFLIFCHQVKSYLSDLGSILMPSAVMWWVIIITRHGNIIDRSVYLLRVSGDSDSDLCRVNITQCAGSEQSQC